MLYQLSYTRVPRILAAQVFRADGVFSHTNTHREAQRMSALWGTSKKSGGSLE